MVKYSLKFLFVFLILSSLSFAQNDDAKMQAKLQKEFGYDLTHAPFFLRFSYNKAFNKDWKESDYPERFGFLRDYEINLAAQQAKEKAEAEALAAKEKERLLEKKEALRKEKERLKAIEARKKADRLAEEERQKRFKTGLYNEKKSLEEMQRLFQQTRRRQGTQGSVHGPDQGPSQGPDQGSY